MARKMEKINKILHEIKIKDIERYCYFWNIHSFEWDTKITDDVYVLKSKVDQVRVNEIKNGSVMTVTTDDLNELRIPFLQLIYDIYAFTCIDEDIWRRVSFDNFYTFIETRFKILRDEGWSIVCDKTILYPQIKRLFKNRIKSVNLGDKIFYIRYSPKQSKVYEEYNPEYFWVNPVNLQEIVRVYLMDVIVKYYKDMLGKYDISVIPVNWTWALNNCLYPKKIITTDEITRRNRYLIGNLREKVSEEKDFLKDIYGEYDENTIDEMFDIPEKIMANRGALRHLDKNGRFINVIGGRRYTSDCPVEFDNTIYMFGGCVFFGYAESDQNTVPSCLQRVLNTKASKRYRVVNLATWGGNIDEEHEWIRSLRYKAGDVILISYAGLIPLGDNYKESDISYEFALKDGRIKYFNTLVHCNGYGYEIIAHNIYDKFKTILSKTYSQNEYVDVFGNNGLDPYLLKEFDDYYLNLASEVPNEISRFGAIVMNCNPFTYGHRYLIEEASKNEECLLIFVVEEDKSEFQFKDRMRLVEEGVEDLKNVIVLPSGKLMISGKTFPEYFTKKERNTIEIDPSSDVFLFARLVAPRFRIYRRYVGEEPKDLVTRKYNEVMREILPTYGIELVELPRKQIDNAVISASDVRKYITDGDWEKIRQIVPDSTYKYLIDRKQ